MRTSVLSLRLSHFRSYRGTQLDTGGQSVALFGPNGAGKTNVLEAISMLSPGRGLRRAATEEMVRRPEALGWKIVAEVETIDGVVEITTAAEGSEATRRTVVIDDKTAPQSALGRLIRVVWLTPAMDRLWMESAGDRRRFLDRLTLGFEPAHGETVLTYEKAMRDRNRLLKEGSRDDAWLSALEAQMARSGARLARSRAEALARLVDAQSEAATFPKADLAIEGPLEAQFSEIATDPDALDAAEGIEAAGLVQSLARHRGRDGAAGRALTGPHRSDLDAVYAAKSMPARACSTGEQKALLISLCLANARALTAHNGTTPLLLLDEVAAHLDDNRRRALYDEISILGCQAWMTGTGTELFEGLADARQLAVTEIAGISALEES
ncbi:MAG: DNA replication/repair protein RecF [Paracoccaceae bacterium]